MKENIFILTGPTGIGKTELSLNLAKDLDTEIISADSMQIYKYMDIGTAKISDIEREVIPHHLIDIITPDENFSVSDYKRKSTQIIKKLNYKNKIPFVVGGTGLYLNSLIYELNFSAVPGNQDIRNQYEFLANENGNEYIYQILKTIDLESANKINVNDQKRIIRAIEIFELTGKTMSAYNKDFRKLNNQYNIVLVCLNMDREKLYDRINKRVDKMIECGLVKEVKKLLSMGYHQELQSMKAIGYKEIIMYFNNELTLDEAINKIKQGSRNYAKRQLTWFRRYESAKWVDILKYDTIDELSNSIKNYVLDNLKNKEE